MQMEMEGGGRLFFDLFVAMCNHMVCSPTLDVMVSEADEGVQDDIGSMKSPRS